jgi:hypothetical protein
VVKIKEMEEKRKVRRNVKRMKRKIKMKQEEVGE